MFRITRSAGFQEEKYRGLYLPLTWTKSHITELLALRVRKLIRHRYTKQNVELRDLLPNKVKGEQIEDFIFSMADRPRDVIAFFNTCIATAVNKPKLSTRELLVAVGEYSRSRLRALADEWQADYPHLLDFARILNGRPHSFKLSSVRLPEIDDLILDVVTQNMGSRGLLFDQANSVIDGLLTQEEFLLALVYAFYRVGLVGLKVMKEMKASWVDDAGRSVSRSQIDGDTSVVVARKYSYPLGVSS